MHATTHAGEWGGRSDWRPLCEISFEAEPGRTPFKKEVNGLLKETYWFLDAYDQACRGTGGSK